MKQFLMFLTLLFLFSASIIVKAQISDNVAGHEPIVVPQNVQSLLQQIKIAEDNEDWDSYYQLREQIIRSWQQVNPEVANIYKRTNNLEAGNENPGPAQGTGGFQSNLTLNSRWGNDLMVHQGVANDISLVSAQGDTLYLSILKRNFGSSNDSVYIYRSHDGGNSWSLFNALFFPAETEQVELLDFWGTTGPSYLMMFYRYVPSGRLWSTRFNLDGTFNSFLVVSDSVKDFAVDRNYPSTNYRAMVLFDSSGVIHSIRSEPSSYGSVWQDNTSLNTVGIDVDMAYGYTGSVYATFNGKNTGNLYVWPNYNFADPTGWLLSSRVTIEQGSTDTTKQAEIIASREDTSAQQIAVVYTHRNGSTTDLRTAKKIPGSSWGSPVAWVSNASLEFKFANLYSRRENGNNIFQAVFNRSNLSNQTPRYVMYKPYDGTLWASSIIVSDAPDYSTGSQNAVVVELPGEVAAFIYAGSTGQNVYFDREDWITNIQVDGNKIPDNYALYQNYPNPFNPNTIIEYSIPENSFVSLKIYNVLGKEIAFLVNEEKNIGHSSN